MSEVFFLSGSMFGKKSKTLIDYINFAVKNTWHTLVYKPTNETRDGLFVKSRDYENGIPAKPWDKENPFQKLYFVCDINSTDAKYVAVFIDEIHFLSKEDVEFIVTICKKLNVPLFMSGLETDFKQNDFESAKWLKENCDHYLFHYGKCKNCSKDNAIYNIRFDAEGNIQKDGEVLVPGDSEYDVVCEECLTVLK